MFKTARRGERLAFLQGDLRRFEQQLAGLGVVVFQAVVDGLGLLRPGVLGTEQTHDPLALFGDQTEAALAIAHDAQVGDALANPALEELAIDGCRI